MLCRVLDVREAFEDLRDWSFYFRGNPDFRHPESSGPADETAAGPR
jgi:hypothetical protein